MYEPVSVPGIHHDRGGLDLLLHRIGWSVHVPRRKPPSDGGEDHLEAQIAASYKGTAADLGAWLCFEDEAVQGLMPPKHRARVRGGS